VLGFSVKIGDVRGQPTRIDERTVAIATVHAAYLLRLPDREKARKERANLVDDLRRALRLV
jgi:DNA polymerase